jgi:magnesium transporter
MVRAMGSLAEAGSLPDCPPRARKEGSTMSVERLQESWEEMSALLDKHDPEELRAFIQSQPAEELARMVSRLDDDERIELFTLLDPVYAADLIEELSDIQGADLLEDLEPEHAAAIVQEMESDERADVLGELEDDEAEAILGLMQPEEAADARQLLTYPEDTAGGVMETEFIAFPETLRVKDLLQELRANAERYADYRIQYIYVVSKHGQLAGTVRLRDLVLARDDTPLTDVMISPPEFVGAEATLEDLDHFFDRHAFLAVPVVDDGHRLIGIVRPEDVEESRGERAEQDLMKFSGIIGGEEIRSMSVVQRSVSRMAWLSLNLVLSLLAASIIMRFEGTIDKVVALAFFLPVIGNMSGCSGNQAVAVSIRELALGLIRPQDLWRVFSKEIQVGLLNGLALGVVLGLVAFALKGEPLLGVAVGVALSLNTLVALTLGGLAPMVLRRLNLDPALSAPPVVTTLADFCGFLILLSLAQALLV